MAGSVCGVVNKRLVGPLTYGTTQEFLDHFGLGDIEDLPGVDELKAAGLLSAEPPEELVRDAEQQAAASRGEKPQADDDDEAPEFDPDAPVEAADGEDADEGAQTASGDSEPEAVTPRRSTRTSVDRICERCRR